MEALPETALFNALVDIVQEFDRDADTSFDTTLRNVAMACADWQECFSDGRGLILLALLSRRRGKAAVEQALLQERHDTDHLLFWNTVQSVYRFSRSNPDFCSVLSDRICSGNLLKPLDGTHSKK